MSSCCWYVAEVGLLIYTCAARLEPFGTRSSYAEAQTVCGRRPDTGVPMQFDLLAVHRVMFPGALAETAHKGKGPSNFRCPSRA